MTVGEPASPAQSPERADHRRSLAEAHDALLLDLDGVVYRGDQVIPAAADTLEQLRAASRRVLFLTNNSSKTPEEVAGKLRGLGIEAHATDVLTSGVATAAMLRRDGASGLSAFVIGERGIRDALAGAQIRVLDGEPEHADLVVVGWDRSVDYARLRRASLLVQRGARLVATNADASYPAPDGVWPGAGAILAAVTTTTGATPTVVGKPARPMFEAAQELTGARSPLVVGDRLDTDIAGAAGLGWASLLVLSGVSQPPDLLRSAEVPRYVGADLSILLRSVPPGRFRIARSEDAAGVRALLEASGLSPAGVEERLNATMICQDVQPEGAGTDGSGPGGGGTDGEPVGGATGGGIAATASLEELGGAALLRSVAVRRDLRGLGLGMLAVAYAVRDARRRGLRLVALFTESAESFFGRMGFFPVRRDDLPEPVRTGAQALEDCAASAAAMVFELEP